MSNFTRRYMVPLAVMILGGILVQLEEKFLGGSFKQTIIMMTRALVLFAFGISLSTAKRKRNESWLKKVLISFLLLFFIFWDLGYIVFPQLKFFFDFIGIEGFVITCFYIYLGASFFD